MGWIKAIPVAALALALAGCDDATRKRLGLEPEQAHAQKPPDKPQRTPAEPQVKVNYGVLKWPNFGFATLSTSWFDGELAYQITFVPPPVTRITIFRLTAILTDAKGFPVQQFDIDLGATWRTLQGGSSSATAGEWEGEGIVKMSKEKYERVQDWEAKLSARNWTMAR